MSPMLFRCCLILLLVVGVSRAQVTPSQVRSSIDNGKAFLFTLQKDDGSWEAKPAADPGDKPWNETGGQWGGTTALALYAMLSAGENPADPRMAKGIAFLKQADLNGTYALAVRCQVLSRLPQTPENRQLLRKDALRLVSMLKTSGKARGAWDYTLSAADSYSHSRTNYAMLGLWAAAQSGVEIDDKVWNSVTEMWIKHQDPTGGWTYKARGDTEYALTPGMTAAGIATLYVAIDSGFPDAPANRTAPVREAIDKGVKWLSSNFAQVATPQKYVRDFPYPTMYAVERVGLAGGLRYIGEHDWYEKIAGYLVANQRPAGGWHRDNRGSGSPTDTAFAILTLARGLAPIAISKLDYIGPTGDARSSADWNLRPRDIANLTRFMGRAMEREINWQIVRLDSPIQDWHESPVLYIEGSKAVSLTTEQKQKLRDYAEQGGLILAAADASSRAFTDSVRKLGGELFEGREWRELPQEHVLFTSQQFPRAAWKTKPSVLGLSNGIRELMLLLPTGDPPRWWQSNNSGTKEEFWHLGADIHQYAAGRENLRLRGDSILLKPDILVKATANLRVARLQYSGNWDPEPAGWRRLAAAAHNREKITLEVTTVPLGKPIDQGIAIAHLTGTDVVKLDERAIDALRTYVQLGGTLLVDSAGGSTTFATSIEGVLNELVPDQKLQPLPPEHAMLLAADGKPMEIGYRPHTRKVVGSLKNESRLQCVVVGARAAVIYSRDDLSAGLVGNDVDGVAGYTPPTVLEMMLNLLRMKK